MRCGVVGVVGVVVLVLCVVCVCVCVWGGGGIAQHAGGVLGVGRTCTLYWYWGCSNVRAYAEG